MKAALVEREGTSPVYGDFPDPVVLPKELLVEITASALSPLARGRASGTHYSSTGDFPFVVGVDGVGRLPDGKRVYFLLPRAPYGGMAERTVVAADRRVAVPDELDDATAALIANPGMSSWAALTERARLRTGETVLVNGATGASGMLAVKIARYLGARRIIATGRNEGILATLGADAIVPLDGDQAAINETLQQNFASGIDVVLDYLWGPSARSILMAVTKAAPDRIPVRYVQIGSAGGAEISLPATVLRSSSIEMKGSGLGSVSLPRLLNSIEGVFRAATDAGLTLDYRSVAPLLTQA